MEDQIKVPQALALLESGELKDPIDFQPSVDDDGVMKGQGQDEFHNYTIAPSDVPCNGTLIIRNKKTGEFQAIPVKNYYMISKQCKIHEFTSLQPTDTAGLVNQFGTRQAKRIYNLRQGTSKT